MKNVAPGNIVFKIEKGSQLVVNEHFLNATREAHDVQSALNLEYVDPSQKFIPAGALSLVAWVIGDYIRSRQLFFADLVSRHQLERATLVTPSAARMRAS